MSNMFEESPSEEFLDIAEHSLVKTDQYQAVFLAGGQVYFCRLWVLRSLYVLKDIYYFQADPEPSEDEQMKVTLPRLVKLGNEYHGPEDQMQIPKGDNVIFWENLRNDGAVVQAIYSYQASLE